MASAWWTWDLEVAGKEIVGGEIEVCVVADTDDGWHFRLWDIEFVARDGNRLSLKDNSPELYELAKMQIEPQLDAHWRPDRPGKITLHDKLTDAYKDSQPTLADDMMAAAWKVGR